MAGSAHTTRRQVRLYACQRHVGWLDLRIRGTEVGNREASTVDIRVAKPKTLARTTRNRSWWTWRSRTPQACVSTSCGGDGD